MILPHRAPGPVYDPTWFAPIHVPLARVPTRASRQGLDLPRIMVTDEFGVASMAFGSSADPSVDVMEQEAVAEAQSLLTPTLFRPEHVHQGSIFFEHLSDLPEARATPERRQTLKRCCFLGRWWHAVTHRLRAVCSHGHLPLQH